MIIRGIGKSSSQEYHVFHNYQYFSGLVFAIGEKIINPISAVSNRKETEVGSL